MGKQKIKQFLSFSPHFSYKYFGVKNDYTHFHDPETLERDYLRCRRGLYECYGHLGLGEENPAPLTTVGGTGITDLAAILGCEVRYEDAEQPYAVPLNLSPEQIRALVPLTEEDFSRSDVVKNLIHIGDYFYKTYGRARIANSHQGYMATAVKLRGDELMYDIYDDPELVHTLMEFVFTTTENFRCYIDKLNRERYGSTQPESIMQLTNCMVPLLSPGAYEEFWLPYDMRFSRMYPERFGIHHCGAYMERYLPMYTSMVNGIYYDIGYGSDVKKCVEAFRDPEKEQLIRGRLSPGALLSHSPAEISDELTYFMDCGVTACACIAVDQETPPENIAAYVNTISRYNQGQ